MKRSWLVLAVTACGVAAIPHAVRHETPAGLSAAPRITVITKNSDLPRLKQNDLANGRPAQGQWI